jgi:hypothetical protein
MKTYATVFFLLLSAWLTDASAAVVELVGAKVTFRFESANTGSFQTWGLATDVQQQDQLRFVPTGFSATSPVDVTPAGDGIGLRSKSEELVVTVTAKPGYVLSGTSLLQKGSYKRWGLDSTILSNTAVSVSSTFMVGADQQAIDLEGDLNDGSVGLDLPSASLWSASLSTDTGLTPSLIVKVSSTLFAFSTAPFGQALATIQNDLTQITAVALPVPLPASFPLFVTALLAVVLVTPASVRNRR